MPGTQWTRVFPLSLGSMNVHISLSTGQPERGTRNSGNSLAYQGLPQCLGLLVLSQHILRESLACSPSELPRNTCRWTMDLNLKGGGAFPIVKAA